MRNAPVIGPSHKRKRRAYVRCCQGLSTENSIMNRKIVLAGLAAVTLAASAAPAAAQGVSVGVGFGDYGYDGWYGPGFGVSVGGPAWGYDNWGYGSYAAAPCTCGTRYRSARVAPGYRYSSYAYGGYPYDDYASYPYDDYYYGGSYASVGLGWSDDGWRNRRTWRNGDRFSREDRVRFRDRDTRVSNTEFRGNTEFRDRREDFRNGSRMSRASMGESRATVRGGANAEFRGGANAEFRGGANGQISGGRGNGAATIGAGAGERRGRDSR
jgi:hypothetical protein